MTSPSDNSPFAGTACYYTRYRVPYQDELIDDIIAAFRLDGCGRLLDLGCGPGTVALRLRDVFEEVIGVDPDPEMIEEAHRQADATGATNVRWLCMSAEEISRELGPVHLVTLGSSFHWMKQDRVLQRSHELLSDDGGIAIFDMASWWDGPERWQQEITRVLKRWLGDERRAGSATFAPPDERYEQILARSPFTRTQRREYRFEHVWTIDALIGLLYSTSFAAKSLFGERAPKFEQDLRRTLEQLSPEGRFREDVVAESLLAWKQ